MKILNWVVDTTELDLRELFQIVQEGKNQRVIFLEGEGMDNVGPYGVAVVWYTGKGTETEKEIKKAFLEDYSK